MPPLFGLAPGGVYLPALLPRPRCALAAPFRPYPSEGGRYAFCGTVPEPPSPKLGRPAGRYPAPQFRGARTFLAGDKSPPRPPGPLARACDIGILRITGARQQQRQQLGPAFAVDDAVDHVGPEPPLEGDHRLLRLGHVIAEPLEREEEAGVGPERVDQVARRARQRQAALGQRPPREQLARVLLARRRDVGMADDIAAADPVTLLDVGEQRDQRRDLLVGKRAVAELMAGIDDLDPDARRIDVGDPAPARLARVPGALRLRRPGGRSCRPRRSDNGPRPALRARSAGRAPPRRRAFRYSGGRSSTPAASARRNWATAAR